jgi:DNA-directed RNA polymerase subunit M/transcription elongation factor TFIIS
MDKEYRNNIKKLLFKYTNKTDAVNNENVIFKNSKDVNEYKIIIYQLINDIKNKKNKNIQNSIWKHNLYQIERLEEEEQNNFIIKPFEVFEGILTCSCGSKRVYSYQKQTRSADEMSSTIAQCMKCNKKWVNN